MLDRHGIHEPLMRVRDRDQISKLLAVYYVCNVLRNVPTVR